MSHKIASTFTKDNKDYNVGYWFEGDNIIFKVFNKDGSDAGSDDQSTKIEVIIDSMVTKSSTSPFDVLVQTAEDEFCK